jgi:hypothetical protein
MRFRYQLSLSLAFLFSAGCGDEIKSHLNSIDDQTVSHWRKVAPTCLGYPSKQECEDGDMALFGGLLCASGEEAGCRLVADSQSSDGRFWRSPRRAGHNLGQNKSFSRDQALGVFLYLTQTGDQLAAQKWYQWIKDHRVCTNKNPLKKNGCLTYKYRFCTDDTNGQCEMNPRTWALMARIWDKIGLPRTNQMETDSVMEEKLLEAETRFAPPGYQMHLKAVEMLLRQRLGGLEKAVAKNAAILVERQPQNVFFNYVKSGKSTQLAEMMRSKCPTLTSKDAPQRQWSWEREDSEEAWRESMVWDCIFLNNLLAD